LSQDIHLMQRHVNYGRPLARTIVICSGGKLNTEQFPVMLLSLSVLGQLGALAIVYLCMEACADV
jgi:hypothetical protein